MNTFRRTIFLIFVGFLVSRASAESEVDFNRDIRPVLSDKCYFCHGPDAENREADLRLDTEEDSRYVFEYGEFVDRINSDDPDYRMPPPSSKLSLTNEEIERLKNWAESGAHYEKHWAFVDLPESVEVPEAEGNDWAQQPPDKFVLDTLLDNNLQPSKPTNPLRWLRRVTFDLTGLPPTLEEIKDFEAAVHDRGETAYAEVVDRLLASPSYGEHMAVAWLDAARYADSYGYQSDQLNTQWPYRDWVVKAFNENLPYDEFLTWQLAGDLLEDPSRDQLLATAFNRLHRLNNEGGAVSEEWRIEGVADRVHTFGTAILGLTLECCRCHDHKYDPIPQRDYYSLSAFFNSIDENGLYDRTLKVPPPSLLLPTEEQEKQLKQARQQLETAEKSYQDALSTSPQRFKDWKHKNDNAALEIPGLVVALGFDQPYEESQKQVYYPSTESLKPADDLKREEIAALDIPRLEPAKGKRNAVRFDGERGFTIKGVEAMDRWTPFSLVVTLNDNERSPLKSVIAHHTRGTDTGFNGWDLIVVDGHVESRMYRVWPGNAIAVRSKDKIPKDEWVQIAATFDGSSQAKGLKIYLNGNLLETEIIRDNVVKSSNVKIPHGGELVIGQRFRDRGFTHGLIDDVRFFNRELTAVELTHLATGTPIHATQDYYASAIDAGCKEELLQLTEARKSLVMAEEAMHEVPIMREMSEARPAYMLARGEYDAPKTPETLVERETFSDMLPQFPEDLPRNRLGLAKWLTQPRHPLTARVIVNRIWQNFFGAGLVRTPENFGLQGELPTHPELLDWLSVDLIEHGWDLKRLCKQIVLSATYRQESSTNKELMEIDPENRLLARGPAYRLNAEQIRDLALAASNLLIREMGGPPVAPYQAGGDLWRESNAMSPPYKQSVGQSLYRRSLYSVWKRTAPLPNMMSFDATSREVCSVNRSRTNTPLQALVLMNDVQFIEAARELAKHVLDEDGSVEDRIGAAFLTFTGREPDTQEIELLEKLYLDEYDYYKQNPAEVKNLLELGDSKTESPDAETAAMTIVCQAILNLDSTIWKR